MKKLLLILFISFISALEVQASMLYKIDKGIDLYNQNNFRASSSYFQKYINSNPNDEDGYFWIGRTFLAQNQQQKATSAFKQAYKLALNDKNIDKIEFENNEYDNLDDYLDIAISYWEKDNYAEALNYTDMMLKIDPDSASAYFLKSKIAFVEGNKDNAVEFFKRAIFLNNSLINTKLAKNLGFSELPTLTKQEYSLYAQKNYFKGNINQSIEYLKKYLELDKENVDIYLALINCYLKNNNYELANSVISEAKKISKNNTSILLLEAKLLKAQGKDYEEVLLEAYKINPNNKYVLLNLAEMYLDKKYYINSKNYYETLISIDDSLYEAYFGYIYSLINLDKGDSAQNLIRKITALNNNKAEISYLLSVLCYTKGEYKEAYEYINNSLKADKNPIYLLQAGKLSYILKDYKNSIQYLQNLDDSEAYEYLIANYLVLNKINEIQKLLSNSKIDKNRILYKYYLYKTSKLDSNKELNSILKHKPIEVLDYLDLAKIYYFENRIDDMNKILNNANKKFANNHLIKFVSQELQQI